MWIVRSTCFPKLHILDIPTICYPIDHIHETGRITHLTNETLIDMSEFNVITHQNPSQNCLSKLQIAEAQTVNLEYTVLNLQIPLTQTG